jgi:ribosome-binding factor A
MSLALKRLEKDSLRELAIIMSRESHRASLQEVTLTEVRITRDLSYMTIFYTVLNDKHKGKVAEALEESKGYLRTALCSKIKARKMPELIFKYDEALAYGNHINEVLSKLNIPHDENTENE